MLISFKFKFSSVVLLYIAQFLSFAEKQQQQQKQNTAVKRESAVSVSFLFHSRSVVGREWVSEHPF